jgi:hypothetical protein
MQRTLTAALALGLAGASHAAQMTPYTNDFSSAANGYTPIAGGDFGTGNASYNLNTTAGLYEAIISTSGSNAAWELDMQSSDFGGSFATAPDFTITASLQWTPKDNTTSEAVDQMAIWFLGNDLSTSNQNWYRALVNADGDVFLQDRTGGSSATFNDLNSGSFTSNFATGSSSSVDFTIVGTYLDTNADLTSDTLSLSFTADRGGGDTVTLTGSAGETDLGLAGNHTGNAYTGHQIGTQFRAADASGLNAAVDSFAVIPEPASLALLGAGSLCLLKRERRSASGGLKRRRR